MSATRSRLEGTALLESVGAPPNPPLSDRNQESVTERVLFVRKAKALPPPAPVEDQLKSIKDSRARRDQKRPLSQRPRSAAMWNPPNDEASRAAALGPDPDGLFTKMWKGFDDLPSPSPTDWLGSSSVGKRDRLGQPLHGTTRRAFTRTQYVPDRRRKNILLVPLGDVASAPPVETLRESLAATWFGLNVEIAEPSLVPAGELEKLTFMSEVAHVLPDWECPDTECTFDNPADEVVCKRCGVTAPPRRAGYGPQMLSHHLHELLLKCTPNSALVVVGFTMSDLVTAEHAHTIDRTRGGPAHRTEFKAVFGESNQASATGVFSFARCRQGTGVKDEVFTRRCCMVLNHEVGHLLGIRHCVFARCLMNGSSSLKESEARPMALCPIDLAKYFDTLLRAGLLPPPDSDTEQGLLAAFLAAREAALLSFFERAGFAEDAARSKALLADMQGEGGLGIGQTDADSADSLAHRRRKAPLGVAVKPKYLDGARTKTNLLAETRKAQMEEMLVESAVTEALEATATTLVATTVAAIRAHEYDAHHAPTQVSAATKLGMKGVANEAMTGSDAGGADSPLCIVSADRIAATEADLHGAEKALTAAIQEFDASNIDADSVVASLFRIDALTKERDALAALLVVHRRARVLKMKRLVAVNRLSRPRRAEMNASSTNFSVGKHTVRATDAETRRLIQGRRATPRFLVRQTEPADVKGAAATKVTAVSRKKTVPSRERGHGRKGLSGSPTRPRFLRRSGLALQ